MVSARLIAGSRDIDCIRIHRDNRTKLWIESLDSFQVRRGEIFGRQAAFVDCVLQINDCGVFHIEFFAV